MIEKVLEFFSKPFSLLDDYPSRVFLILFLGSFTTFFLYFFNPMGIQDVAYPEAFAYGLSLVTSGIWGACTLTVTQFGLRRLFSLDRFNRGQFLLWFMFEMSLATLVQFTLFGESGVPFLKEFYIVFKYTFSLALLPYLLACLLIQLAKLTHHVKKIDQVERRQNQYIFRDKGGKLSLTIKPENILYLKSENNYTSVVYRDNDVVAKKLIRTNLKLLEKEMAFNNMIRIHRSYMVNLSAVRSTHRARRGFEIQLDYLPDLKLKVSSSYQASFEKSMHK